jgi:hypothetical protein
MKVQKSLSKSLNIPAGGPKGDEAKKGLDSLFETFSSVEI